jgi:hypothetical protein
MATLVGEVRVAAETGGPKLAKISVQALRK